jgi:6-pyruvoyltetrahydropterin/6-carboxytetrahydropterin synthase
MLPIDPQVRIGKTFTFHAAHHIPHHEGKCKRPHGHTYQVEIEVEGPVHDSGPQAGMVVDFADISRFWKAVLEPRLDHQDLNETLKGQVRWTTAEEIATFILNEFRGASFTSGWIASVCRVRVWETPTSFAEVGR